MNPTDLTTAACWAAVAVLFVFRWRRYRRKLAARAAAAAPPKAGPDVIPGFVSVHEACEGVLVLGGTGSGKTSGPGQMAALHLLRAGAGFCVLTAKVDEFSRWQEYAKLTGRGKDLVRVAPGEPWRLDFINEELTAPGGSPVTVGHLMADLADAAGAAMTDDDNPFFRLTAARFLRHAVTVVYRARGACSVRDVHRFVTSMPRGHEGGKSEVSDPAWLKSSFCAQCLAGAEAKHPDDPDLDLAGADVLITWPGMSSRTAGVVMAYAMATLDPFLQGDVAPLVTGPSTLRPKEIAGGKIVVIDTPVLRYRESGRLLQVVWKQAVQRETLRRPVTPGMRPVVVWMDEGQFFLTASDCMTQTVARQSKLVTVLLAQNLPLLFHARGGGEKARQEVEALLANFQTKILCSNSCKTTNDFFSGVLGSSRHLFRSSSVQPAPFDLLAEAAGTAPPSATGSASEQWHPDVPPEAFTRLRKGGPAHGMVVEAYLFQAGKRYRQNRNRTWVKLPFPQA